MPCRLSQRVSSFHSEPSRAVEEPKGMKIEKLFRVEDGLMDFFPFPGRRTCVSLCFFARRTFWGGETSIRPRSHNELTKTIYIYIKTGGNEWPLGTAWSAGSTMRCSMVFMGGCQWFGFRCRFDLGILRGKCSHPQLLAHLRVRPRVGRSATLPGFPDVELL